MLHKTKGTERTVVKREVDEHAVWPAETIESL